MGTTTLEFLQNIHLYKVIIIIDANISAPQNNIDVIIASFNLLVAKHHKINQPEYPSVLLTLREHITIGGTELSDLTVNVGTPRFVKISNL